MAAGADPGIRVVSAWSFHTIHFWPTGYASSSVPRISLRIHHNWQHSRRFQLAPTSRGAGALPVVCWPFTPPARELLTSEGSNYRVSSGAARKDTWCATVSLCPRDTGCEALGHGFTMLHCRCYWDNSYGHSRNGKSRYFHSQGQHYRLVALMPVTGGSIAQHFHPVNWLFCVFILINAWRSILSDHAFESLIQDHAALAPA